MISLKINDSCFTFLMVYAIGLSIIVVHSIGDSFLHNSEHPSPLLVFPSSHSSPSDLSITQFPHDTYDHPPHHHVGHCQIDGVVALHEPSHCISPFHTIPQPFGILKHTLL